MGGRGLEGVELGGVDGDLRALGLDGLRDLDRVGGDVDGAGAGALDLGRSGDERGGDERAPTITGVGRRGDHGAHAQGERRDHRALREAGGMGGCTRGRRARRGVPATCGPTSGGNLVTHA